MVELISKIISNVLTSLYQPFWFSLLSAVLFLFFYLFVKEHGWKEAIRRWIVFFKTSVQFRRLLNRPILCGQYKKEACKG